MPKASLIVLSLLFLLLTEPVLGCSMCMFAIADYAFPPSFYWAGIAGVWYIGQGAISEFGNQKTIFQLKLLGSILLVLALAFIAMAFVGPWVMFFLFLGPAPAFFTSLMKPSSHARRLTVVLGATFAGLLLVSSVFAFYRSSQMTKSDYILRWTGTSLHRQLIREMKNEGPASLPVLRQLLREGDSHTVYLASNALGEISDDQDADMRLLIEKYRSVYAEKSSSDWSFGFWGMALRSLSGLELPDGASPDEWEQAWSAKIALETDGAARTER